MTALRLREITPHQLNSATKYPSIPTYHTLRNDGGLVEPAIEFTGTVIGREKIDGCNVRILFLPDGNYVIGTREDLLFARGDYLSNGVHGIVDDLVGWAEQWRDISDLDPTAIHVFYGEYYGGKGITPASKQYTATARSDFRLFDIALVHDPRTLAAWDVDRIAAWREADGPHYLHDDELVKVASAADLELAPRLFTIDASGLPRDIDATHQWLTEQAPSTRVALDTDAAGRAEGIVVRTPDRSRIAKLRFQNYNRTRQLRAQPGRR